MALAASVSRRMRIALLCAVQVLLVGVVAAPSSAAPSELDAYTKGACGAIVPGAYVEAYTHWVNDDRGTKVAFYGNASGAVKRCSNNTVLPYSVRVRWTVTANGWSVDSCSAGIDGIFSCSASSSSAKWDYDTATTSGYRRVEILPSNGLYFGDSYPGDISTVCSRVEVFVVYNNIERLTSAGRCNDA